MSNALLDIVNAGLEHPIHKWMHYFPLYDRHFSKYRSKTDKIIILEIGVKNGGSLDLWNKYFGSENCEIYGVDIDLKCKKLEGKNIKIFIGDQEDREFLKTLVSSIPPIDILIDDGGHTMIQQINTFEELYQHVKPGGVYLCEDTHTSYWTNYGGGFRKPNTFMEYTKELMDKLNHHHHRRTPNDHFTQTCVGISVYDSMVFFEKASAPLELPRDKVWPGAL